MFGITVQLMVATTVILNILLPGQLTYTIMNTSESLRIAKLGREKIVKSNSYKKQMEKVIEIYSLINNAN